MVGAGLPPKFSRFIRHDEEKIHVNNCICHTICLAELFKRLRT